MSVLSIIKIPYDYLNTTMFCLNKPTEPILFEKNEIETLKLVARDMLETLYSMPSGVGLAANQVGLNKKMCVIDIKRDGKSPLVLLNPVYTQIGNELTDSKEVCLSYPNISVIKKRFKKISVVYYDFNNQKIELIAEGFKAMVIQHEVDHLNGISSISETEQCTFLQNSAANTKANTAMNAIFTKNYE